MKPGATARPFASMMRPARVVAKSPSAAMRSPLMATSVETEGLPRPSKTRPLVMMRSNAGEGEGAGVDMGGV